MTLAILQTVNFDLPAVTFAQTLLAVMLLVVFFLVLTVVRYRTQYAELGDNKRHKAAFNEQISSITPSSIRVYADQSPEEWQERISGVLSEGGIEDPDEPMTVREAMRILVNVWADHVDWIPRLVRRLAYLAVLIGILGAMVREPIGAWKYYLSGSPDYPTFQQFVDGVTNLIDTTGEAIFHYPYADFLWSLAFSYSILLAEWIYNHPYVTAITLAFGAVAIFDLYRRTPQEAENIQYYPKPWSKYATALIFFVGVWFIGASLAVVGNLAGTVQMLSWEINFEPVFEGLGFFVSVSVLLYGVYLAGRSFIYRSKEIAQQIDDRHSNLVPLYVIAQRLWGGIAVVTSPYVLIYFIVLVSSGKIYQLINAFLNSSTDVKILLGTASLVLASIIIYGIQQNAPEVISSLREASARKRLRAAIFARTLPFGVMALVYVLSWGLQQTFVFAVFASVVSGIVARLFYVLFLKAKYSTRMRSDTTKVPESALVQAYRIEDADGEARFYVNINGETLAHSSLGGIQDSCLTALDDLFNEGRIQPSLATFHAEHMTKFGTSEIEETRKKIIQKMKRDIFPRLERNNGSMSMSAFQSYLEKYPEDLREEKMEEWRTYGTERGRLDPRGDMMYLSA